MKRVISLLILLVLLLLMLEWGTTLLKSSHKIEYQVNSSKKTFKVIEEFQKKNDNTYYLEIISDNHTFIYDVTNTFNKQKEIIESIEVYEKNDILCIYPNLINDKNLSIQCSIRDKNYSYESIKDNSSVINFVSTLKEKGYREIAWENQDNTGEKRESVIVYKNNFLDNDKIIIWNYKGITVVSEDAINYKNVYNSDKYENNHGTLVGKYYIMPVYLNDRVFDFKSLNVINLDDNQSEILDLDTTLNQDTYINGVVNNKLYYFDSDNVVQYEIDPYKNKVRLIGDKNSSGQFYDGEWNSINIYDFVGTKKEFELKVSDKIKEYSPVSVYQSNVNYYYMTSDNSIYKINKNRLDKPILLLRMPGLKEIKVIDDILYFIVGDTLYYYSDSTGIRKIIKNNEWNYNFNNIYDVYKETK